MVKNVRDLPKREHEADVIIVLVEYMHKDTQLSGRIFSAQ